MGKSEIITVIILFNVFFILFIVGIMLFIKQYKLKKKEHEAMLTNQRNLHKKQLMENQLEIQKQTMQQIGREIHDNVGQKLTLASLYTQQLAFENKAPQVVDSIDNISNIINESLSELRKLSKSLTVDVIAESTIYHLIGIECEKVKKTKKCLISFEFKDDDTLDLSYQQKSILLRICQEFINNSLKYAQCKEIQIFLKNDANNLILQLHDDGIGFDVTQKTNGIGLENIKKRTELLKGTSQLSSNSSIGTRLVINIPLTKQNL